MSSTGVSTRSTSASASRWLTRAFSKLTTSYSRLDRRELVSRIPVTRRFYNPKQLLLPEERVSAKHELPPCVTAGESHGRGREGERRPWHGASRHDEAVTRDARGVAGAAPYAPITAPPPRSSERP